MDITVRNPMLAALASAVLFGLSTPLAKLLIEEVSPVALAGLLYLGSGVGLLAWRWWRRRTSVAIGDREAPLVRADWG